jgi:hypothetical protein
MDPAAVDHSDKKLTNNAAVQQFNGAKGSPNISFNPRYKIENTAPQPGTVTLHKTYMQGMDWGQTAETIATTMVLRRSVGTLVQAAVNRYTGESFKTDENGEYIRNESAAKAIRSVARVMDKGYDRLFGKNRSNYEITAEGKKELGLFADVTDEAIEKGYFRKRFYNLRSETAELPDEERPQHRAKSYGRRLMEISTDFACMGQADYMVNRTYMAAKDALSYISHSADPNFRNSPEFIEWKKKQSLPRAIGKIGYDMVENAIRGDFLYDFAVGILYTPIKEFFSRRRSNENSELKNTHIHYNIPFVAYNWLGMLVWQDLLVDWWLRPSRSKLREYMDSQQHEPGGIFSRLWNGMVDLVSFSAIRSVQIGAAMYPAVSIGFSPGRHYGEFAAEELKQSREQLLIERLFEEIPRRILERAQARGQAIDTSLLQMEAITHVAQKTPENLKTPFETREKQLLDHIILHIPAHMRDDVLRAREDICKNFYHQCLAEHSESVKKEFYKDYMGGSMTKGAIQKPDNLKYEADGSGLLDAINDKAVAIQDAIGHPVKQYVAAHSGVLQGLFLTELNAKNALLQREYTVDQYKKRVELADAAAERYVGYAPYFSLKRTLTDFTWKDPSFNITSQAISWMFDHLKLGNKANMNLAQKAGDENGNSQMRHDPALAAVAQALPERPLKGNNAPLVSH